MNIDAPFVFFRMEVEPGDGQLVLRTAFGFRKHRILAAEYPEWRRIAGEIDKAEKLTLRLVPAR